MKYSIITPVYNRQDCIGRCIDSVIYNIKYNIEIEHIIVDDGSSDATASIVKSYSEQYKHIKFIQFRKNRGTNAARNTAISVATGKWIIILDSDDYFVDNAIEIIDTVVSNNKYKEYMFAADDMLEIYNKTPLLTGKSQVVLKYKDFLAEDVKGDFIHVIDSEIMKRNPFNENLRIYEFVWFLTFYKESQEILFTDKVVTIRERSRTDSVTREVIRTNKKNVERNFWANCEILSRFKDEYIKYGLYEQLAFYVNSKIENALLISKYQAIKDDINSNYVHGLKGYIYKLIYMLHLGAMFRVLLQWYLNVKYNIIKRKLK